MRTRFSDVDYFVTAPIQALETLTFFQLPVAQVSPSPPATTTTIPFSDLLLFLRSDSAFEISLSIENLPIQTALSKFFSDVLPQNIVTDAQGFDDEVPSATRTSSSSRSFETRILENTEVHNEEKEVECQRTSRFEAVEIEVAKKINGNVVEDKFLQRFEVSQFETPELDVSLENASFFDNKGIQILSQVPEIEESLDMHWPGLATHYHYEVRDSVLSVEDITLEFPMEQRANSSENCSFQDQSHFSKLNFPILEVDEIALEHIAGFSVEAKFLSFIDRVELSQNDNLELRNKELLGSKEYDLSRLLSDHCLSTHALGYELGSQGNFPEIDLICLVEISQIRKNSGSHGRSDDGCFLLDEPFVFQESHILDADSSQIFEDLFNRQTTYEPETCDLMFNEYMNFKNFNKLIVSPELTLVDDTFRSLPVPVLPDHEKLRLFYTIIEGKFAKLKPQPLSALDGIYLDWHILEEVKYDRNTYFDYENVLGDMGSHNIDFDWDSFGDRIVVFDFIFSDDGVYGNMEENGESKELLFNVSIPAGITLAVESSTLLGDKFPQPENGECLSKRNAERASLLFKSTSQSNDLDFFLNSKKATMGTNSESTVKAVNNNAASPNVALSNSVADISQGGESITILDRDEDVNKQKKPFDHSSVEEKYNVRSKEVADKVEACSINLPVPFMPFAKESKNAHPQESMSSFPETVILVNTQNLDKEMIALRRSTYQRILALEKEGAQVVERDSNLPVDVVINSAICLVWYDCRNIGKKATALDEASSCLPLCIENIATNVLTLLSFTFSGCILVFEGENTFLSTVMESSDGLYAAAASLGIDVQLFCSYSSDLTDEIIMSCIGYATRGVYSRMPESETIAESFLTKFPSINPLTAHAVLSSGATLIEFLEWSNKSRIFALQRYYVPEESINLFGALCKYGEREGSRSIMTDYSSSVSSGADSFSLNVASKRKRWNYNDRLDKSDIYMDDLLHIDSVKEFSKHTLNTSSLGAKQYESSMSIGPGTFHEVRKPRPCESSLFDQEQGLDVAMMMNHPIPPEPYDFQTSKEPQRFKEIKKPELFSNYKLSGQLHGTDVALLKNFDLHDFNTPDILFGDQQGEVIDLTGSPASGKEFSSMANSLSFLIPEMEKDATRKSKTARRLSFGKNHQPNFPRSSEIYSGSNIWNTVEDQRHSLQVGASKFSDTDLGDTVTPLKKRNRLLEDCFKQRSAEKSQVLQFQEKNSSHYGDTPFSNAIRQASPQQKTPWTMEFLNRIREKSRFHHQSLPCDTSAPCFGCSGNVAKVTKRRSPSILEYFKYQGGSTVRKIPEQKKHTRSIQSSSSKHETTSAPIHPTWTPVDKRARQVV
ncbi:hypothetical protein PanWU01x14_365340 [Parasponia andersonii]|uniref:Protein SHORTAGE IN CHIASMATA 1 n=1 Tax=Parasponia andersonii TaxID=3476 RepID=A0A2P5A615_PARAD|nr:hypothetical protein PanWU01x14_365340 [Parasponia andersonii]